MSSAAGDERDGHLVRLLEASIVHKTVPSEVLIGDYDPVDHGARFWVSLPPTHRTVPVGASTPPAVLLLELVRQLGIATAHLALQVPPEWVFIANSIQFSWLNEPMGFPPHGPLLVVADVQTTDLRRRKGVVSRLAMRASIRCAGGSLVAKADGALSCLPRASYRVIRRNARHGSSQHTRTDKAVLNAVERSGNTLSASIGWDWRDRFQFDHDADHLPGMVLAAAVIDAHKEFSGGVEPYQMSVILHQYAELDCQPILTARVDRGDGRTEAEIAQSGRIVASACLR